jgi:hypothetical protein
MLPREVDAFCVAVIGDILDGSGIFKGQYALNNTTVVEQMAMAKGALEKTILKLNEHAETYVFFEPGNHGRMSRYGHPHDNLERIMFEELTDRLAGQIACSPPDDNDIAVIDVEKTTGVLMHKAPPHIETHHQRGKVLSELYEHDAGWVLSAHLHHIGITSQGFWFFRNGSLMNRGERHAAGLHLYDSPRQLCLVIDGDKIVGSFWVEFD